MIARLKYQQERTRLLTAFVDTYLRLNAAEQRRFDTAIKQLPLAEREATMELTTSWKEEGLQQGLQQGLLRERELVLRLLERRVGKLSKRVQTTVERLPIEQLESLGEALLDFRHTRDLTDWLTRHTAAWNKVPGTKVVKHLS